MVTIEERRRRQYARDAAWFRDHLLGIAGKPVAFWIPKPTDTLTNVSSPDTRTWTHANTQVGRVSYRGNGVLVSCNGTSDILTTPDADDLSFNTGGLTDLPFSIAWFGSVTNTVTIRDLVSKYAGDFSTREWVLTVQGDATLLVLVYDQSSTAQPSRTSTTAIIQGSPVLLGCSYDGGGGATAANGITLYQNASVKASTATNNALYVAMENTTTVGGLMGSGNPVAARFTPGSAGFAAVYGKVLTPAQFAALTALCSEYYAVALP